jgi:predicted ATPase
MGIQEIEIKGFRSLRDVKWKPGRLNVLIGPNGSGKSNLLDACALLQEAARGKLSEGIIRRGGMGPLLWNSQEKFLSWKLQIEQPDTSPLTYFLEVRQIGQTSNYSVDFERLDAGEVAHIDRTARGAVIFDSERGHRDIHLDTNTEEQSLLYALSGPFGNQVVSGLRTRIEGWEIYQDLRVDQESMVRRPNVTSFEKRLSPNGQNLVSVLFTRYSGDREFKRSVDMAMRAAFGVEYEEIVIAPAADQRVQLRLRWRSLDIPTSAANLSDGTLRFLMLVTILANPEPGELIAIDEPETGLHPRMFPILTELALDAAERTQVILTTHSPEFLNAFRAEAPTTTVAELVDGVTRLSVVDPEELARWLKEYSLGSIFTSGELEAIA